MNEVQWTTFAAINRPLSETFMSFLYRLLSVYPKDVFGWFGWFVREANVILESLHAATC